MTEKSNVCPHLSQSIFSSDVRESFCEILKKMTGLPVRLGSDRLTRYCRGEYRQCLLPEVHGSEVLKIGKKNALSDSDWELLEALANSPRASFCLIKAVYSFLGIPSKDQDRSISNVDMLAFYRKFRPAKKLRGKNPKFDFRSCGVPRGFGIKSFKLLEDYLLRKGLISESVFID